MCTTTLYGHITRHTHATHQRGATLLVGMILLLLITMIGVSGIQITNMQERMAGAMKDRNEAFQAAEAGLRAGENILQNVGVAANTTGLYTPSETENLGSLSFWESFNWSTRSASATTINSNLAEQPRYVIDAMKSPAAGSLGESVQYGAYQATTTTYRVTARGTGFSDNTQVILQTTYRKDI